jgi:hypothetical protein
LQITPQKKKKTIPQNFLVNLFEESSKNGCFSRNKILKSGKKTVNNEQ